MEGLGRGWGSGQGGLWVGGVQRGAVHRNVDRVGDLPRPAALAPAHDASPAERRGVPHGHAPVAVVGNEDAAGGEGESTCAEHLAVLEAAAAHGVDEREIHQPELQQPTGGVDHVQAVVVVGERRWEVEEAWLRQAVLIVEQARRAAQLRQALPVADLDAVVLRVGHREALEPGQWFGQWQDARRVVELAGRLARLPKAALPAQRGPRFSESFRLPRGEECDGEKCGDEVCGGARCGGHLVAPGLAHGPQKGDSVEALGQEREDEREKVGGGHHGVRRITTITVFGATALCLGASHINAATPKVLHEEGCRL